MPTRQAANNSKRRDLCLQLCATGEGSHITVQMVALTAFVITRCICRLAASSRPSLGRRATSGREPPTSHSLWKRRSFSVPSPSPPPYALPLPASWGSLPNGHAQVACFASGPARASAEEPQWKMYTLSGTGSKSRCEVETSDGFQIVTDTPKAMGGSNEAAQPVFLLLSALCGCETATAQFVARQMKIRLRDIKFEINAWRDQRGAIKLPLEEIDGYSVPSHLQVVEGTAVVDTTASQEQIDQLAHQVHRRCPVASMMTASGCRVNIKWVKK